MWRQGRPVVEDAEPAVPVGEELGRGAVVAGGEAGRRGPLEPLGSVGDRLVAGGELGGAEIAGGELVGDEVAAPGPPLLRDAEDLGVTLEPALHLLLGVADRLVRPGPLREVVVVVVAHPHREVGRAGGDVATHLVEAGVVDRAAGVVAGEAVEELGVARELGVRAAGGVVAEVQDRPREARVAAGVVALEEGGVGAPVDDFLADVVGVLVPRSWNSSKPRPSPTSSGSVSSSLSRMTS